MSRRADVRLVLRSLVVLGASIASAQEIELASRARYQLEAAGGFTGDRAVSPDGRFVAFTSPAPNLAPGQIDLNFTLDVFLYDALAGSVTLVSHTSSASTAGNGISTAASVSASGDVVFQSHATDLGAGFTDPNGVVVDVFHYRRTTGAISLVSHTASATTTGSAASELPAISDDGSLVAFRSNANDLGTGLTDGNNVTDVFLYETATGNIRLVSHTATSTTTAANGASDLGSLAAGGAAVAFQSRATNLVTSQTDTPGSDDVFAYDVASAAISLVSHTTVSTTAGNGASTSPAVSGDGSRIAFASRATNLGATYTNVNGTSFDVFLYVRASGAITLLSHTTSPTTTGNASSQLPAIDATGSVVAFESHATDLQGVTSDPNGGLRDVLVWSAGVLTLASHASSSSTTTGDSASQTPITSPDGGYVAFSSYASNLDGAVADANSTMDAFLFDRSDGSVTAMSRSPGFTAGNGPSEAQALTVGATHVILDSYAWNLGFVDRSNRDVLRYDRAADALGLVSRRDVAAPSSTAAGASSLDVGKRGRSVSDDGRFVTFESEAGNLVPLGDDANGYADVFLYDAVLGTTTLVSHAAGAPSTSSNRDSHEPAISADGRFVAYSSLSTDLVAGQADVNVQPDVFLWDRTTGVTRLVSHTTSPLATPDGSSTSPRMDGSGRYVVFTSTAADLGPGFTDTNFANDVFLFDATTGSIELVSHAAPGTAGSDFSLQPALSRDGSAVAFISLATDLGPGWIDGNGDFDVFLYDVATGGIALVSHAAVAGTTGDGGSYEPQIGATGAYVAFESIATDLGSSGYSDANGGVDVFLYERATGAITLASHAASPSTTGNASSFDAQMSDSGGSVAFTSDASNLGFGNSDGNGAYDVFLWLRSTGQIRILSHAASPFASANGPSDGAQIARDGSKVAFVSSATNLGSGITDTNGLADVFIVDAATFLVSIVSHGPSTTTASNFHSDTPRLNATGSHVAFGSYGSDLVAADLNLEPDVFLFVRGDVQEATGLLAAKGPGSTVSITYAPACGAIDHEVFIGNGPIAGSAAWSSSACGLGRSGTAAFDPGTPAPGSFLYFVVVGQDGVEEGSYGQRTGAIERPEAIGIGACDAPRELGGTCP